MTNLTSKNKDTLLNWWDNKEQETPIILGYSAPLFPEITDINEYWAKNKIRYDIFKELQKGTVYYGCAIPHHYIDFGSSAMAGVLGCKMNPLAWDTIWPSRMFEELPDPGDIYIKDNEWYHLLYELIDISLSDTGISTTFYALGGINDTLGSLYGEQNLLLDMIDRPMDVKLCLDKICDIWISEKDKMYQIIKSKQEGMSSWAGIWAQGSTFPIQEDISYMLGVDTFNEFCLPYIKRCVDSLDYPIYHLDGPGAIKHLDSLLEIQNLRVIQWVPGINCEEITQWYSLIKTVLDSGRSIQVTCTVDEAVPLIKEVGSRGLLISLEDANEDNITKLAEYL